MGSADFSPNELQLFETLISSLKSGSGDVLEKSSHLLDRSDGISESLDKGVSFLTTKCHLLLGYVIDLALISLRRCSGASINGCLSLSRLIEARTFLEKMKPIDHKLKYQIDKLLKIASTGGLGSNDALLLKANPDNLASKLDEEADGSDAEPTAEAKLYKPPKLTAAYYAEANGQERTNAAVEKAKKRALSSSIMQELRQEYHEGPEEIVEASHVIRGDKALAHKRKYEEENFVRLSVSKSERQRLKRMQGEAVLGSLTRFEDISALTGGSNFGGKPSSTKSKPDRKGKGKQKRGKANKFKRRK